MSNSLRITSWNINSVRARLDIVERYLRDMAPDILCLQETKVINDLFPEGPFRQLGYRHFAINGMPAYHGVAIISKCRFAIPRFSIGRPTAKRAI